MEINWAAPRMQNGKAGQYLGVCPQTKRRRVFFPKKDGAEYGTNADGTVYLYDEEGSCCQSRRVPEDLCAA